MNQMTIDQVAAAARESDAYRAALARLPGSRSGEDRALLLESMAAEAGHAARSATSTARLAWEMTATLLRQLAAAQRGLVLHMVGDWEAEHDDAAREWKDVAMADTSGEFAAAFAVLHAELRDELQVHVDPGDPATPALVRLAEAAGAIGEAAW